MDRFRPKTGIKGQTKTLLKSYDFKKPALMQHKTTKSKNKDLFAIQQLRPSGKSSIVTKTIDEISELKPNEIIKKIRPKTI